MILRENPLQVDPPLNMLFLADGVMLVVEEYPSKPLKAQPNERWAVGSLFDDLSAIIYNTFLQQEIKERKRKSKDRETESPTRNIKWRNFHKKIKGWKPIMKMKETLVENETEAGFWGCNAGSPMAILRMTSCKNFEEKTKHILQVLYRASGSLDRCNHSSHWFNLYHMSIW